jgi:hypothetical protein
VDAGELCPVRRVGEDEDHEEGGREAAGVPSGEDGDDGHDEQQHDYGREQARRATQVERRDRARLATVALQEQRRYQEAAENQEEVDTEEPARKDGCAPRRDKERRGVMQ